MQEKSILNKEGLFAENKSLLPKEPAADPEDSLQDTDNEFPSTQVSKHSSKHSANTRNRQNHLIRLTSATVAVTGNQQKESPPISAKNSREHQGEDSFAHQCP